MEMKKNKIFKAYVLFLTTAFATSFLASCGGDTGVTPASTADLTYTAAASSVKPTSCACKAKAEGASSSDTDINPGTVVTSPSPSVSASPGSSSTGVDLGENLPELPGTVTSPMPSAAPEKKKTLVGQWIEKIGGIFKKKKTT